MSHRYKERDPSPITSQKALSILNLIEHLNKRLKELRLECKHDWEVTDSWDGHDGYSWIECEIMQQIHCKICGEYEIRKTGKFNKY